jgi:hypothetical protein
LYYPSFEPHLDWLKAVLLLTDEVVRLIPQDAGHVDSEGIQHLKRLFPESLTEYSPNDEDTNVRDADFSRLEIAFSN